MVMVAKWKLLTQKFYSVLMTYLCEPGFSILFTLSFFLVIPPNKKQKCFCARHKIVYVLGDNSELLKICL